ncbi:MAG TPA: hypothetical protein PLV92_11705, partial [Pirellulaceae bacterium]|nr:hypothetical protein [Pirellulaceae bacterium]
MDDDAATGGASAAGGALGCGGMTGCGGLTGCAGALVGGCCAALAGCGENVAVAGDDVPGSKRAGAAASGGVGRSSSAPTVPGTPTLGSM